MESVEKFLYEKEQELLKEREKERNQEQAEEQEDDDIVLRIEREITQMIEEFKAKNDKK